MRWDNKHEFLSLPLDTLDKIEAKVRKGGEKSGNPVDVGRVGKEFT